MMKRLRSQLIPLCNSEWTLTYGKIAIADLAGTVEKALGQHPARGRITRPMSINPAFQDVGSVPGGSAQCNHEVNSIAHAK